MPADEHEVHPYSQIHNVINNTNRIAKPYSIELTVDSYEERLGELIENWYEKTDRQVVFLVDEYDKPILEPEVCETVNFFPSMIC